jgi:hypothetical protein
MPFFKEGSNLDIKNATDLRKYSIAVVRGVRHTADITKNHPNVYISNNTELAIRLVLNGTDF